MEESIIIAMTIVSLALIVGLTINGIVDKVMTNRRLRQGAAGEPGDKGAIRAIAERQQMIEDRLRVLERIATDRGTLLAGEIEALRGETVAITKVKDIA